MKLTDLSSDAIADRQVFIEHLGAAGWTVETWDEVLEAGADVEPEAEAEYSGNTFNFRLEYHASNRSLVFQLANEDSVSLFLRLFPVDLKLVLERITGRWSCPKCGRVYHIYSVSPNVAGLCDDCSIPLTQRADDSEAVVRKRFEIYRRHSKSLADHYQQQGKLTVVDAALSPEERFASSGAALN